MAQPAPSGPDWADTGGRRRRRVAAPDTAGGVLRLRGTATLVLSIPGGGGRDISGTGGNSQAAVLPLRCPTTWHEPLALPGNSATLIAPCHLFFSHRVYRWHQRQAGTARGQ